MHTLGGARSKISPVNIESLSWFAAICLSLAATSAPAFAASSQLTVDFPLTSKVGPLKAGQLCLPKGSVKGTDFISDQGQFALLVRQLLDAPNAMRSTSLGDGAAPRIDLHFTALAVKLCAKSWGAFGLGDTKSLSGKTEFTFSWRAVGSPAQSHPLTVALQPASKDRMTAPSIMQAAVEEALRRIGQELDDMGK